MKPGRTAQSGDTERWWETEHTSELVSTVANPLSPAISLSLILLTTSVFLTYALVT